MRESLNDILCCPVCKDDLELSVEEQDGDDVVEGSLYCEECDEPYEITDGIPDLLPPEMRD